MQNILNLLNDPAYKLISRVRSEPMTIDEAKHNIGLNDLPEEYMQIIAAYDQFEIFCEPELINIYNASKAALMNDDPAYTTYLPDHYFFADDAGGNFYAFDHKNSWGKGKNAIYLVPMGAMEYDFSKLLAANLSELIVKMNGPVTFTKYPEMGD